MLTDQRGSKRLKDFRCWPMQQNSVPNFLKIVPTTKHSLLCVRRSSSRPITESTSVAEIFFTDWRVDFSEISSEALMEVKLMKPFNLKTA